MTKSDLITNYCYFTQDRIYYICDSSPKLANSSQSSDGVSRSLFDFKCKIIALIA